VKVVAEGLETPSQLRQLKELKCDYGQGYYFAKSLEAKATEDLMKGHVIGLTPLDFNGSHVIKNTTTVPLLL